MVHELLSARRGKPLLKIADLLEVDIKELIVREYKSYIEKVNSVIDL